MGACLLCTYVQVDDSGMIYAHLNRCVCVCASMCIYVHEMNVYAHVNNSPSSIW